MDNLSRRSIVLAVVAVFAVAAALRLWDLELRPPHHDEGVNGWFTERVIRDGYYPYDPSNYHGPSYFYLLAASRELLGFGLWQLRLPTALIGIALCFVPLVLRRRLGWPATLAACAMLATSPTLVYYARYAIHETLLAALGLLVAACTLRWADCGNLRWIVAGAIGLAAMVATKETTILFLAAGGSWLVGETLVESIRARRVLVLGNAWGCGRRIALLAVGVLALVALLHTLFFTAALQAPGAVTAHLERSLEAYMLWSKTGTEQGGHVKDLCYYVHLGLRYELVLYGLAVAGTIAGFRQRAIRGPALVGFAMLALYSAIPYKMPWLPVSWLALLAVPAGHGALAAVRVVRDELAPRVPAAVVIAELLVVPVVITYRSSFVQPASAREALAYVHTDVDYKRWFPYVGMAAEAVGAADVRIAVVHPTPWPLAWSLLPYPGTRWSVDGDEHVIMVAPGNTDFIEGKLTSSYLRGRYRMRDSAEDVVVYLRHDTFASLLDADARAQLSVVQPPQIKVVRFVRAEEEH